MIPTLETTILRGLIHNETYTRRVLPYLKDSYFESSASKIFYRLCSEHFSEYGVCTTPASLQVSIESLDKISEEEFQTLSNVPLAKFKTT